MLRKMLIAGLMVLLSSCYCFGYEFEYAKDLPISTGVTDIKSTYDFLTKDMDLEDSYTVKYGGTLVLSTLSIYTGHEVTGHGSVLRQLHIRPHYCIRRNRPAVVYTAPNSYLEDNAIVIGGMEFETELRQQCLLDVMKRGKVSLGDLILVPRCQAEYLTSTMHGSDMENFVAGLRAEHPHSRVTPQNIRRSMLVWLDPAFMYNTYYCFRDTDPYSFDRTYPDVMPSLDFRLYPNGFTNEISLLIRRSDCLIKLSYENGTTWKENVQGGSVEFRDIQLTDKLSLDVGSKFVETCVAYTTLRVKYGRTYVKVKSYYHKYFTTDTDTLAVGFDF